MPAKKLGWLAALAAASLPTPPVSAGPKPPVEDELVGQFRTRLATGESRRLDLDPVRTVESIDLVWSDAAEGARCRVVMDGIAVARRRIDLDDVEPVSLDRRAATLEVVLDEGEAVLERVQVRYVAPIVEAPAKPHEVEPVSSTWTGEDARVLTVGRDLESGDRVRIPAAHAGRRIRAVRVKASALDFRARVKLTGGGLSPATRMVARSDTAVFETANVPDDTADLLLTADFRRVRITEITVVYEPKVCVPTAHGTKD